MQNRTGFEYVRAALLLTLAAPVPVLAQAGAAPAAAPAAAEAPAVPIGPMPAWAEMLAPPPAGPAEGAFNARLFDTQFRFGSSGHTRFQRTLVRLNSPEALQVLGRSVLVWDPVIEKPVVHRLVIHRGTETIDVLARQSFQVLRRERELESAVLDGQLTAFLQVADLRVGDELEFIVSIESANPLLGGHDEAGLFLGDADAPIGRLRLRASWPATRDMRWQAGPGLPAARDGRSGSERWMQIEASDYRAPPTPADAPGRYAFLNIVRFSDFSGWPQVSAVFAPAYDAAAVITPGSPLAAEADRIAAASPDPVRRAELALALVQKDVRYVANLAGLGAYQPAPAESVWRDRFGDCKGKTVLLLALLRRLGISAVPSLVAQRNDDGLEATLPMPGRFDHVVVRATIAGRTYWLDGTRLGDASLANLAPPTFRWTLPLTVPGSALVEVPRQLPTAPLESEVITLEQPADLSAPAKARGVVTYRGAEATSLAAAVALIGPARAREEAQQFWKDRRGGVEVTEADIAIDKAAGEARISMTGTVKLEWKDGTPRSLTLGSSRLGVNLSPKRDPGAFADAPVAVGGRYGQRTLTLVLPGPGFTMTGEAIDTEIGGIRYVRRQALDGNRLTMTTETRAKSHEVSLAEAKAADVATDKLWERVVVVTAPVKASAKVGTKAVAPKAVARPQPAAAAPGSYDSPPSPEAAVLLGRAAAKAQNGAYDEALALLDNAGPEIPRDTKWTVLRTVVLLESGRTKEADRASEAALAKAPRDPDIVKLRIQVLEKMGRKDDELILLDRLIVLQPDDATSYVLRGELKDRMGDAEGAIADYDLALQMKADDPRFHMQKIRALNARKDWPAALKAVDAALAEIQEAEADPFLAMRGNLLVLLDRPAEAKVALDKSLAIEPNADAYLTRASFQLSGSAAAEIDDLEAAIRLEPEHAVGEKLLQRVIAAGGYERIAAAYQAAHAKAPTDADIIMAADRLNIAAGKPEATLLMLDTALALDQTSARLYNERCWLLATERLDLGKALADCDAALKLRPGNSAVLDSRGLVWLQMGQHAKALADYEASVAAEPEQTSAIYGRGLAKMLLKQPGWEADIAAARKRYDGVDADYAGYKLPFALPPAKKP